MKKLFALYFSPTGTTQKTVATIAGRISSNLNIDVIDFNFTYPKFRSESLKFTEDDLVVIGLPVVAGRVPNLMIDYLKSIGGNGAIAVGIVMYGNRAYDDALNELVSILRDDKFQVIAAGAFVGEHSFSEILAKGRPDMQDINEMKEFADIISEHIKSGDSCGSDIEAIGCEEIKPHYVPVDRSNKKIDIRRAKPKTNDRCTACGICAEVCPLGSISHDDYKTITGVCMKCCACIKKCPNHAKYFDDEGFLYHKTELEEKYIGIRCRNEIFI